MAKPEQKVALPIQIEVTQAELEKLQEITGKSDVAPNLTTWCRYFLTQYMNGGFVVTGAEAQQIDKVLGVRVSKGKELVDLALKAKGREDSQYNFHVRLDPVWIGPMKDTAKTQGVTAEYLLEDVANAVVGSDTGWAYSWHCQRKTNFTADDWKEVQSFTGKDHPFGADIAASIRALKD